MCLCAQSIEFETVARVIGHLGIRMSMIAYPIVAINKVGGAFGAGWGGGCRVATSQGDG